MLFTHKHPEVRFHGAQSVLASVAVAALYLVLGVVSSVLAGGLDWAMGGLLYGVFVLWIVLCIKGYNLEHFKLPLVGDLAERWTDS
jgi:uncharacterized membrane protein